MTEEKTFYLELKKNPPGTTYQLFSLYSTHIIVIIKAMYRKTTHIFRIRLFVIFKKVMEYYVRGDFL